MCEARCCGFLLPSRQIIFSIGLALGAKINFTIDDKIQLFCSLYKRIISSPFEETRATYNSIAIHNTCTPNSCFESTSQVFWKLPECSNNKHRHSWDGEAHDARVLETTALQRSMRLVDCAYTSVSATGPVLWPIITGTNYPLKDWRPTFERLSPAARLRAPTETESWRTGCERVLVSDL